MFKVRKFKKRYFIILLLVFVAAVWLNLQSLEMASISCTSMGSVCNQILPYLEYTYFAYASIILFALMILYWFVFHKRKESKKESSVSETTNVEANYRINFEEESSRDYRNSYLIDKEEKQ